jgi:hypothetical protein
MKRIARHRCQVKHIECTVEVLDFLSIGQSSGALKVMALRTKRSYDVTIAGLGYIV